MARLTNAELSRQIMTRGLKDLLATNKAFRMFCLTLFNDAGIFIPTYSHGSPYDTAYREGRRAMGLEVLHLLKNVQPDILSIIEREGNLLAAAKTPESEDDHANLPNPVSNDGDPDLGS